MAYEKELQTQELFLFAVLFHILFRFAYFFRTLLLLPLLLFNISIYKIGWPERKAGMV